MPQLLEFSVNHWPLVLAFVVLLALIIRAERQGDSAGVKSVNPEQATRLINKEHAIVLDLRDGDSYKQGHIVNARHLPQADLKSGLAKYNKHKSKPLILTCQNGSQSRSAGKVLQTEGFEKVYAINGGLNAWRHANLPLVQGASK